jgi:hypothetical protein
MGRGYIPLAMFYFSSLYETYFVIAAGVVGKITNFLAQVIDPRPPSKVNLHNKTKKHKAHGVTFRDANGEEYTPRAEYLYYEVEVDSLAKDYPESDERIRKWV